MLWIRLQSQEGTESVRLKQQNIIIVIGVCHPLGVQSTTRSYTIRSVPIIFSRSTRTVYNLASTLAPPLTAQTSLPHTSSKASSIVPTYAKPICVLVDCGRS